MAQTVNPDLPTILCLHGHGTNAAILRHQTRALAHALAAHFRLVFVDSPLETAQPGEGIPAFLQDAAAGMTPYRRWHHDARVMAAFDLTADEIAAERRRVRDVLAAHVARERPVGVLAFSQGTRVATALCRDRGGLGAGLRFAVMICGFAPDLPLADEEEEPEPAPGLALDPARSRLLDMPSVHVQCTADPWFGRAKRLVRDYFKQESARTLSFRLGHEVPSGVKEAAQIAAEIEAAYASSQSSTT